MQTTEDTLYEVLGVGPTASDAEIKAAYRRLARLMHPDVGGTAALFRQIGEANETLSDPIRRAAYDEWLRNPTSGESAPEGHRWAPTPGSANDGGGWAWDPQDWDPQDWVRGPDRAADPDRSSSAGCAPPQAPPGSSITGFLRRQPWACLIVAGLAATAIAPAVGLWMLLLGMVAAVGARRAQRHLGIRRPGSSGISGLRLLGAEVASGCLVLFKVVLAILGVLLLVGLLDHRSSRGGRR